MDARNEFKVMFSPEPKGMKERIVPAISKVFSPSHFIHAQKKKAFYKALSGLAFHDSNVKDKKSSPKNESVESSAIYMSKSEGYTPKHTSSHENQKTSHQIKNKSDKFLRRTLSEKSVINDKSSRKYSYDSMAVSDEPKQRENVCSQRTRQKSASLLYDNLASDSRRLRSSIGGYDNVKRSFGSYDNIKRPDQRDQLLTQNSNERKPENRSHSVHHITVNYENSNDVNSKQEYPVRPERTRSSSQSRRLGTTNAPDIKAFQRKFENNEKINVDDVQRANILVEKYEKNYIDNLKELKNVDKDFRSRSRRRSEKSCDPELRTENSPRCGISSKNIFSHNKSNDEKITNEEGKRPSRYIKNKRSSISNSQPTNKKILPDDVNRRVSLGCVENSNRIRAYSRQSSEETNICDSEERRRRFRSKSVITPCREQIIPLVQGDQYNNDQPQRPRRARSTSRSKAPIVSNIFNIPHRFKSEVSKDNHHRIETDHVDYDDYADSGLEDNDSCNRSKSKPKKHISSNEIQRRSKYLNDHSKQDNIQSGEDGGYYSLEKEENIIDITKLPYQLPSPAKIPNQEYFQSDHSLEAIYISQVFMNIDKNNVNPSHINRSDMDFRKRSYCDDYQTISHILGDDIYDNCQSIRSEKDDIAINDNNNENYQIVETLEETEIYEVPFDSKTPDDNDDLYETIEFTNYEQVDNSYINQSLPIVDDSDEEGDYMDIKDFPAIQSETKVTVITIKDSDVEVTEKSLPSSNIPITTPTQKRHDGYFNPYVGKKLSQPNGGEIYDNMIKSTSHLDNSNDFDSMAHSYPVTKAMIPKIPERNRVRSSSVSMNTPLRQTRPNLTKPNNLDRFSAQINNNRKTSLDSQKSNGYEFMSETNYKVDNLDYTFRLNFSQLPKGSSHTEFMRQTSFRSKTAKVSLASHQENPFNDLLPPLTFQDLLKDKHINPPEHEAVLDTQFCDTLRTNAFLYPESHAQKHMDSWIQNKSLSTNRTLQRENSFGDNISICWSEADSDFEFMNVTK